MEVLKVLEELLRHVVDIAIVGFEFVGVFVIILAGLQGMRDYVRKNPQIRLNLAIGMALGLEFKLGSEILRCPRPCGDRHSCRHHCSSGCLDIPDPLGDQRGKGR